jgi:hypothetical protein
MVNVKLELDKLTSLLATYHILCAPTKRNMEYNPDVFSNLNVPFEIAGDYVGYLLSRGVRLDETDSVRPQLFFPDVKDLAGYLDSHGKDLPDNVKSNLREFELSFDRYFKVVKGKVEPLIEVREEESAEVIDSVYDAAVEMTGVDIERPEVLEVRVVEGLAPHSIGSVVKDKKGYVVMQTRNFMNMEGDSYLLSLIHEAVAHQAVMDLRQCHNKVFGRFVYQIEEGFAKLFTRKIAEKVLGREVDYRSQIGTERTAYEVCERNWDRLKERGFSEWYKDCVRGVFNECSSR